MSHSALLLELFGYAASVVVLVSLLTTNILRLRILNAIGSAAIAVYAVFTRSWPVCAINVVIAFIDVWYVFRTLAGTDFFTLETVSFIGEAYFRRFWLYHEKDLRRAAPDLDYADFAGMKTCLLFRNLLPVGLFAYRREGAEARIAVDYMIPEYRDFKAGRFLYANQRLYFKEQGIKHFAAEATHRALVRYYLKNGFVRDPASPTRFLLEL